MDDNIEQWSNLVVQYSVMSKDQLETLKTKGEGKSGSYQEENKSSCSDDSFTKNELLDEVVDQNIKKANVSVFHFWYD